VKGNYGLRKVKGLLRKSLTPITIMVIPHERLVPLRFNVSFLLIIIFFIFACMGAITIGSLCVDTIEYYRMKEQANYLSSQFIQLKSTIASLKRAEHEFSRMFSLKSKDEVMERVEVANPGSIDLDVIKKTLTKR